MTHSKTFTLFLLVGLFALQLVLRTHANTRHAVFIDEDNHIRRGATTHTLTEHPAQHSHGKFLFYLWLAVVDLNQRDEALFLSRAMVALASLLTSAVIFTVIKRLGGASAGLWGVAFYALLPYAFFFERVALADPWAGFWGALTVLISLRFAQVPTYRRAFAVGVCSALAVAAKLTMAFSVGFPVLAVLFLTPDSPLRLGWSQITLNAFLRRYLPPLVLSAAVFILLWLPILIPARLSLMNDTVEDDFIIAATDQWIEPALADSLSAKLQEIWIKYVIWASLPTALLTLGALLYGLWTNPRMVGYLVGCLILTLAPSTILVKTLQSRYMMAGLPILVMALGVILNDLTRRRDHLRLLPWGFLILWGAFFALPFAENLITDPPSVTVPATDSNNYFWGRYNSYGNEAALAYLAANGERSDGQLTVFPLTRICDGLDMKLPTPEINLICLRKGIFKDRLDTFDWYPQLEPYLREGKTIYVLTSEQPDVPPPDDRTQWIELARFEKPHQQVFSIIVWAVTAN